MCFHVRILLIYCHFQGVGRRHGVHRAHATLHYSIQLNIVIQLLFLLRRSFNENDLSVAIMQDNKDLLWKDPPAVNPMPMRSSFCCSLASCWVTVVCCWHILRSAKCTKCLISSYTLAGFQRTRMQRAAENKTLSSSSPDYFFNLSTTANHTERY